MSMNEVENLFVFRSGGRHCALPLGIVERVIRAVEITPAATGAATSTATIGVIDVQGEIVPVLDLRRLDAFSPTTERHRLELSDQLILVTCEERRMAIVAQSTMGVMTCPARATADKVGAHPALIRLDDEVAALYSARHLLAALQDSSSQEVSSVEVAASSQGTAHSSTAHSSTAHSATAHSSGAA